MKELKLLKASILCFSMAILALVIALFFGCTAEVGAVEWHTTNQATIAWDPVTYDGLADNERLAYRLVLVNMKTDPEKTAPAVIGTTTATEYTLTLADRGQYAVGAQTIIEVQGDDGTWAPLTWTATSGNPEPAESDMAWSDMEAYAEVPFGIRYIPLPDAPTRIRPVSPSGG